jgi:hypothetical protein
MEAINKALSASAEKLRRHYHVETEGHRWERRLGEIDGFIPRRPLTLLATGSML